MLTASYPEMTYPSSKYQGSTEFQPISFEF